MIKHFLNLLLISVFCLGAISCGKRGDLLPPEGYQAPDENN